MRNNTKLLYVLLEHDLNISLDKKELCGVLVNKETEISCSVYGRNISELINRCLRLINANALNDESLRQM